MEITITELVIEQIYIEMRHMVRIEKKSQPESICVMCQQRLDLNKSKKMLLSIGFPVTTILP